MTRKAIAIALLAIASIASLAAFANRGNGGAVRGAAARAGMMYADTVPVIITNYVTYSLVDSMYGAFSSAGYGKTAFNTSIPADRTTEAEWKFNITGSGGGGTGMSPTLLSNTYNNNFKFGGFQTTAWPNNDLTNHISFATLSDRNAKTSLGVALVRNTINTAILSAPQKKFWLNGTQLLDLSDVTLPSAQGGNIYINGPYDSYGANNRMWYAKIWKSGVLVGDFVPAKDANGNPVWLNLAKREGVNKPAAIYSPNPEVITAGTVTNIVSYAYTVTTNIAGRVIE